MEANYWLRALRPRVERRRVLVAGVGGLVGGALLAACGSSGGGSSDKAAGGGLLTTPVDTTKQARKGGVFKDSGRADVMTWDPTQSGNTEGHRGELYSTLVMAKTAPFKAPLGEFEGDIAESWEMSPDRLQLTFRLHNNAHFAPLSPTNGRQVDAQDVVMSYDYYAKFGNRAADIVNSVAPGAPITSLTAPDSQTIVVKLAFPSVVILDLLSGSSYISVLPREAFSGGFELKNIPRGSGAFYLSEYSPSVRKVLKKNPGYHLPGPNIETWEVPILPEYAAASAQFRAGNIYRGQQLEGPTLTVPGDDMLQLKRDVPGLMLAIQGLIAAPGQGFFGFASTPKAPFRDERVRQALSMSLDRDLWIDTFYGVSKYASQGVNVKSRWSTGALLADMQGEWLLDPQAKDFGENARYFKRDITEAKKLLAAAGYPAGFEVESHHIVTTEYGRDFPKMIEAILQMGADAGMRIQTVPAGYATDFRSKYRDVKPAGDFEGISWVNVSISNSADPTQKFYGQYGSKGDLFKGFDPDGASTHLGDRYLDDLTTRMQSEPDVQKRISMAHDLQRYDAKKQYYLRFPGGAEGLAIAWPAVGNFGVYQGGSHPDWSLWLDSAKAPLKS